MFSAFSMTRLARLMCPARLTCCAKSSAPANCLVGCAIAFVLATAAHSQVIEVSLNVHYADPGDAGSGGTWEIVAKSSNDNVGIFALSLNVLNIDLDAENEAPRGNVGGSGPAGFAQFGVFPVVGEDHIQVFAAQEPRPSGQQGAFYGVGRLANGSPIYPGQQPGTASTPGSPNLTTLTNVQDVPWATGDPLGNSNWNIAAMFASGTFAQGVTPSFATGHDGHVFTGVGTVSAFGPTAQATIDTIVRTNFSGTPVTADYNDDGVVDAADYVAWRKNPTAFGGIPNGYNDWVQQFGQTAPPGAGGSVSVAVPEPAGVILLVFGLASVLSARRRA